MPETLTGKVAFVTGAARGQGRAHAVKLASEGADILALDIAGPVATVPYDASTPEELAETKALVEAQGRRILTHEGDVRDLADMKAFVDRGVAELGRLDVIVANAGICSPTTWDQITPEIWSETIDINLTGVWNTAIAGAQHIIDGGAGGSIVLISSYAGKKMQPFMIHYTASKHALVGMTRGLAAELGRHDIRVNSVHPGAVHTKMGSGDMITAIQAGNASHPHLAQMGSVFLTDHPAVTSEDIANMVAFLASDGARYVTSEHISVDSGAQYY